MTAHKSAAKTGKNYVFHNAIRSYGWENFEWEILEESSNKEYLLNEREEYWIRHFNSHYVDGGKGYNMTFGGEATFGWVPSEETRRKISESNKGRKAWNKGMSSPWTSERNRANRGKKSPKRQKEYTITDPEGNKYEIKGLVTFCKAHNLHCGNMSSVAKGKLKHYKGWKCQQKEKV